MTLRKSRVVSASLGAVVLGVLAAWLIVALRAPEPTSNGKPLSYWLAQLAPDAKSGPYSWLVTLDQDEAVRSEKIRQAQTAIHAIGPQAVPFLLDKIRHKHSWSQRVYGGAWPKIPLRIRQHLSPPKQFQSYGNPHSQIVWALKTLDSEAVPALIAALRDYNSDVQITALAALGGLGASADAAIPSLVNLAKHPNGFVRRWAIFSLGRMGPKCTNALPTLIAALKDDEISPLPGSPARVRETAAEVLGQLGPQARAACPELQKLLTDADAGVSAEAAIALWRIAGDPDVLPILIARLKDNENRRKVISVLGEIGPMAKAAVPAIKEALGPLPFRAIPFRARPPAVHLPGSTRPRATLEEVAREALQRIDPEQVDEPSDTTFAQVTPLTLNGSGSSFAYIGLGNRDKIAALGPSAAPALVQFLQDRNPETRIQTMLTLAQIGWKPTSDVVPTLTRLLEDRTVYKYRGLEDKDLGREFVCIGDLAAEMLGQIGSNARPAVGALRRLLADPDWGVRPYASLALWRIDHDTNVVQAIGAQLQNAATVSKYRRFLLIAAEMGAAAKPVVPDILRGLTNFTEDLSRPVREVLLKIDQEAATQFHSQGVP